MKSNTKGKKRKNSKAKKKRNKLIAMLVIEAFLLIIVCIGLWGANLLGKIQRNDLEHVQMNEDITEETQEIMKGYTTIALFGIDVGMDLKKIEDDRSSLGPGNRSDTIIIANVNNETGEVKMVSVYRDTYLNLANDKYSKCNSAYSAGGPDQAVQMLNMNLDLNIQYYVSVDWKILTNTIDMLGGVEIDVQEAELDDLNGYIIHTAYVTDVDSSLVESAGLQTLDGVQATSYCRIRYVGNNDFRRTERQREVIKQIVAKSKKAGIATLVNIVNEVFPRVMTNFTSAEILGKAADAMSYDIGETAGFPFVQETKVLSGHGDCVVPVNLEDNVRELHRFLFDEDDYYPSPTVIKISNKISADTGIYGES